MSLRIRRVLLRIETDKGPYGAEVPLEDGLVILHAANSRGKSTIVQAIIYALGLEGMYGSSQEVPLPHVMTHNLTDGDLKPEVEQSYVSVEIENARKERVVVTRSVKGIASRILMNVDFGPALSQPGGTYTKKDFFVRDAGSAHREAGFHHFLANWVGWNLPQVDRFDGTETLLYMQCMFPLMVVEQKRGWAGIGARIPIHFRIRDVAKRATEFLLSLDVYAIAIKRQCLLKIADELVDRWKRKTTEIDAAIRPVNGVVEGMPKSPGEKWLGLIPAARISRGREWVLLSEALSQALKSLNELELVPTPTVGAVADDAQRGLLQAQEELASVEASLMQVFESTQLERGQLEGLNQQIRATEREIQRNKDNLKVKKLGSQLGIPQHDGTCPTCHQSVTDSLLPQTGSSVLMSVEVTIAHQESQRQTFLAVRASVLPALQAKERDLTALRVAADDLRLRIRTLKGTLTSAVNQPDLASVEERVILRQLTASLTRARTRLEELSGDCDQILTDWKSNQRALSALPADDLSSTDHNKLQQLEVIFTQQAREYGVTSLPPESLAISRETYRPIHRAGFELDFDLSASDTIRAQWAYLHGMLELSRTQPTNHLGLLIFDEPRQQETEPASLTSFITRAARARAFKQQVIIATSEQLPRLRAQLESVVHQFVGFEGYIIKKLQA